MELTFNSNWKGPSNEYSMVYIFPSEFLKQTTMALKRCVNTWNSKFQMSIENIKNLFCKRVQESFQIEETSSPKSSVNGNDEREEEFQSLKEADAGITEYLTDCKGFSAVIKQRYADFHVHEIDADGNTVYLTNRDIPVVQKEPVDDGVLSEETWEKLKCLCEKQIESVEIDVTNFDKEKRREIHKAIKYKYGSAFISNTIDENEKRTLRISCGRESNRSNLWFGDLGKYLHFVLFKRNLDTTEAINILASKLRTKAANLTYAGTKDKRANTSQWVSMWHLDARKLNGINKVLRDMSVGNYVYKDNPLKLGDLSGNVFEIALRNVTGTDEVINEALNTVKENGFINYFGLQRFGNSFEVPTHEVGRALVKGDFKTAVELILKPRKGKTRYDLKEARKVWWETRDAERASKCFRSKDCTIERKLLQGLAQHGKNAYVNALDLIPRNVRLLYLHSYQSFLWNKILSKRIKKYGKSVIEGDLVISDQTQPDTVKVVSKEEISNYDIYDIVHPLPGYNITYPENIIKEWYEELLQEDNLTFENFKQTVKQYSLSGTQRHIVKKLKDFSWHVCYYSKPEEDLILSDLDKLNNVQLEVNTNSEGKYKAIVLKLSLDGSTYATMALREILKIDTSTSYQVTLNSYSYKRELQEEGEDNSRKKSKT